MSTGEERFGSCSACEGASFIRFSFQRFFQHFKSTSHLLLLKVYQLNHIKNVYFWMSAKLTLKELAILLKMQGNLRKIIAACNVSKNAASLEVLFCHILRTIPKDFRSFSKFFQSISRTSYSDPHFPAFGHFLRSTSHSVPFKFICVFERYTKWKMQVFNPIALGNATDNANGCQMMSYSNAEKDDNCWLSLNITKWTA